MSNRRLFLVGLITAILLFAIPLIFLGSQYGGDAADAEYREPTGPIAEPAPHIGLPEQLTWWPLLSAGLLLGFAGGIWLVIGLLKRTRPAANLSATAKLISLSAVGFASLVIYVLNFLWPFPLGRYFNLRQITVGLIADRDARVALGLAVAMVALFALYGLAYHFCRGQSGRRFWAVVIIGVLLFALVNVFVATITTLDLYDYIARGRITGLYRGNPYVDTPADYPQDPFMDYTSWREATSAYGPLWEILSALLSRVSGDQLWPNVLAYKGLALFSYLLCVFLIAAILRRVAPDRALLGTLLFAWNPVVLLEGVANGHNDMLMVGLMLAAFSVLSWRVSTLPEDGTRATRLKELLVGAVAILLLTASVLVKFIPGLLFPFFFFYLLARQKSWAYRIGLGAVLVLLVFVLVLSYYLPFWVWPEIADTFSRRATMFRMSVPGAAREVLMDRVGDDVAQLQVRWVFLSLFGLSFLGLLWQAAWNMDWIPVFWRQAGQPQGSSFWAKAGRFLFGAQQNRGQRHWDVLAHVCYSAFLLYLLLANFWFWPWYLLWPIALLALSNDHRTMVPLTLAGCAGQLSHLAWNFTWYWWGVSWETLYQVDALVVFLMVAPALLIYLVGNLRRLFKRETERSSGSPIQA